MHIVLLSGEHNTLPKSELLRVLEAEFDGFHLEFSGRIAIVDGLSNEDWHFIGERLALSHFISELIFVCRASEDEILNLSKEVSPEGTYSIRIKRIGGAKKMNKIESRIGEKIGGRVNLTNPQERYIGLVQGDTFYFSKLVREIKRGEFEKRRPHLRPFFHPGSLHPRLARALVNLSGCVKGEMILDPFCGTGGFLIEAGLIGVYPVGIDIDERMLKGTRKNLLFYGIKRFHLTKGDARRLPIDPEGMRVVCDPPYGLSTIRPENIIELYERSLEELSSAKRIVTMAPVTIKLEEKAEEIGLNVIEKHFQVVHDNLSRFIYLIG